MKIKVGDAYRDYMGVLYVVKSYKNFVITFEVDGGKMEDETYGKHVFQSELDGNRFHKVELPQKEISDEEIEKELVEYKKIIDAIRQGTGMSIKDAKRSLVDVRNDIVVICKQWYRENGKKF